MVPDANHPHLKVSATCQCWSRQVVHTCLTGKWVHVAGCSPFFHLSVPVAPPGNQPSVPEPKPVGRGFLLGLSEATLQPPSICKLLGLRGCLVLHFRVPEMQTAFNKY